MFQLDLEKAERNQRTNCQHPLDPWKSKRVPEKHLLLLYWLCQSLWLCESESCSVISDSLWPRRLYCLWNSPGQNTGVGSLSLLQGIFPNQGSNPGLWHCRRILYQLNHQGSPRILEWVTYPFSSRSSWPRDWNGVSFIAGGFFTNWAIREASLPDHITCLLRNLSAGQEARDRTGHGTTDWLQIRKGVCQGCILSPCLFNFYAEYIMRNARLDEAHTGIKIAGRNINNLRYADDTTFMAESEEELKSLLMKMRVKKPA